MKNFFTKDRLRTIISFVLASLVCLGAFLTALSAGVLYFIKDTSLIKLAKDSKYTSVAVQDITEKLNDLSVPSGLPSDFFNDKINLEEFETIFYSSFKNVLANNKDYTVDIDDFENMVLTKVTEYSENESGEINDDTAEAINAFAEACGTIYLSHVNPSILSYVLNILGSIGKYVLWANIGSVIFLIICVFLLFKVNTTSRFSKYMSTSFLGAALTIGVIPAYLLLTDEISKVGITSKSLFTIVTALGNGFLSVAVVCAAILAVISILFVINKIFRLIFRR